MMEISTEPNAQPSSKKVFIIGAGPSGVVALKEMVEAGHDAICMDAKSQIGGLFSVAYQELYTTTSNMFLAFSDFPPEGDIKYWSKDEYLDYLNAYVDHFQLRERIFLNTAVTKVTLDESGTWKILTKPWKTSAGEMRRGSVLYTADIDVNVEAMAPVLERRYTNVHRSSSVKTFNFTVEDDESDFELPDDESDLKPSKKKNTSFFRPKRPKTVPKNNEALPAVPSQRSKPPPLPQRPERIRRGLRPSTRKSTYEADYLIVASGTNQIPRYPDLPKCKAEVLHSADFTNAGIVCENQRVLVIGNGESAMDVAAQSCDVAKKVTLWSRRDFDLAPRFISTFLTDATYNEREMLQNQERHNLLPRDMLESITNSRIGSKLPTAIFSILLGAMLSDVKEQHGKDSAPGVIASIDQKYFANDFYNLDTAAPTKSGGVLAHAVAHHGLDIIISPKVDFRGDDGRTAHFEDISFMGREAKDVKEFDLEVDLIILCTGFRMSFNWLDVGEGNDVEVNPRKWFKHCFPPGLGHKMACLGYARPAQGGIPQCSEMLARYAALLVSGERTLPSDYADQAIKEGQAEGEVFYTTPNATALLDFSPLISSVARLIGCEPSIPLPPARFVKFWTLPQWVCFYRLNGPGANPEACWKVCDKFNTFDSLTPMPLLAVFTIFALVMQPIMIFDFLFSGFIDFGMSKSAVLPRFSNWRVGGHYHQLSGNKMRFKDLVYPSFGFLAIDIGFLAFLYAIVSILESLSLNSRIVVILGAVGIIYGALKCTVWGKAKEQGENMLKSEELSLLESQESFDKPKYGSGY